MVVTPFLREEMNVLRWKWILRGYAEFVSREFKLQQERTKKIGEKCTLKQDKYDGESKKFHLNISQFKFHLARTQISEKL